MHFQIVHFVDMVTRQNENVFRFITVDERDVLVDCIGRSLIPFIADGSDTAAIYTFRRYCDQVHECPFPTYRS